MVQWPCFFQFLSRQGKARSSFEYMHLDFAPIIPPNQSAELLRRSSLDPIATLSLECFWAWNCSNARGYMEFFVFCFLVTAEVIIQETIAMAL